jgi:hypothetical protein
MLERQYVCRAALATAMVASATAGGLTTCSACYSISHAFNLPVVGTIAFGGLLLLSFFPKRSQASFYCLLLVFTIHTALLASLRGRASMCYLCAAVWVSEILALISSVKQLQIWRSMSVVALGILIGHLCVQNGHTISAQALIAIKTHLLAETEYLRDQPELGDRPALVAVFYKEHCPACSELENEVLTPLKAEFGATVEIIKLSSPSGIPNPSIVIGRSHPVVLIGLHDLKEIISIIRVQQGL